MATRGTLRTGVLIAVLLSIAVASWAQPAVRATLGRVVGTVRIQRGGVGPWVDVTTAAHRKLYGGDHVLTLQSSEATIFIDGNRVDLQPRTHVIIPPTKGQQAPRGMSRLWAVAGRIFIWLIGTRNLELGTEGAIARARGTKFAIEVDAGGMTTLTVLEDEVEFFNDLGHVVVKAGEQSTAGPRSAPTRPMRVDPSGYLQWEASLEALWLGWEIRYQPDSKPDAQAAQDAAQAAPDDPEAQIRAGDALNDVGELLLSEQAYRRALDLAPQNAAAHVRLGLNLLQQVRLAEAKAEFITAQGLDPRSADPLLGQAAVLTSSGDPKNLAAAEGLISQARVLEPEYADVDLVAGVVAMRQGQGAAAAEAFRKALAAAPGLYQAQAYLAVVLLAAGDEKGALQAAQAAVNQAPSSGLAHESLATAQFFAGDLQAARVNLEIALLANPTSATARLLASDIAVAEGDLNRGAEEARMAVALDPLCGPAFSALGMIALAQNDLGHAGTYFRRSLELSPNLVAARTGMGVTYARQGKLAKALEAQKAAIALDSSSAATHHNLGAIYLSLGKLEEAEQELQTALKLQPNWCLARANLALVYLDENRFADAVREGELAVKLGERSARVYTTLARVYLKQNRMNKAWAALRRALELDENYALAHLTIAEVYNRQGRARDALKHQLEAIASEPASILETREYARTEARVELGSFRGEIKKDGKGDEGQNSYFLSAAYEKDDYDRLHSDFSDTTGLAIFGRQTAPRHTNAVLVNVRHAEVDKPGVELPGGVPEDVDYETIFSGRELQLLARRPMGGDDSWTLRLGYRDSVLEDYNPDSLTTADPKPFRGLRTRYNGPMAELRMDAQLAPHQRLVAGLALSGEDRSIMGIVGTPTPGGDVTWTRFSNGVDRDAATLYAEHQTQLSDRTRLMVGGRLVAAKGMEPVARPKASLRHKVSQDGTLVLLTRPVLRDDVSEISPVDNWALRDWLSPLDLGDGGYSQSYELQYELMPADGSLLRLSGFYRDLRNYVVDLQDPRWAPGEIGLVLSGGSLRGGELEWERWLGRDLSAGIWIRFCDSRNDDAGGLEVPYQPRLAGSLRLDYLDINGYRAALVLHHVGRRYADLLNTLELGSYSILNLSVARQCSLNTDVYITVENLLDREYQFRAGYPGRGTEVRGGVLYRF